MSAICAGGNADIFISWKGERRSKSVALRCPTWTGFMTIRPLKDDLVQLGIRYMYSVHTKRNLNSGQVRRHTSVGRLMEMEDLTLAGRGR